MCKGVQGCSRRFGGADVPALSLVASHPGPRSAPTLALGGANPSISLEIFFIDLANKACSETSERAGKSCRMQDIWKNGTMVSYFQVIPEHFKKNNKCF